MSNNKKWLSPRVFAGAVLGWLAFYSAQFLISGGVYIDGARQPFFSAAVQLHLMRMAVPFGVSLPILLHLGDRHVLVGAAGWRFWVAPAAWTIVTALLHALVMLTIDPAIDFTLSYLGMYASSLTLPYSGLTAIGILLGERRLATERESQLLQTQLRVLRSQLQPHFLFNTLQAIGATARSDADTTVRMTALLGDLLRQSLRERSGDLVTLAEERDLLLPYVELQRLRFGDRLTIALELPDDLLDAEVPDLLLQPLVENALRHGIETTPGAGTVVVRARRDGRELVLQVVDDGAGPPADVADGVGLGTTRARLQGLFGGAAALSMAPAGVRGTMITVRLPLSLRRGAHAA